MVSMIPSPMNPPRQVLHHASYTLSDSHRKGCRPVRSSFTWSWRIGGCATRRDRRRFTGVAFAAEPRQVALRASPRGQPGWLVGAGPVSYTHLTLPTILRVE